MRLPSRLSAPAAGDQPVARRGDEIISESGFRARAAGWTTAFARCDGRDVALFEPDGVEFAAALIGAWHAGKTVFLPGDTLPATCRDLAAGRLIFAGAFPPGCATIASPPDGDAARAFDAPDENLAGVVIYTSGSTGEPQALPKTLSQLAAEVETLDRQFGAAVGQAETVATVSHQHIYGLLFKILWPLCARRMFLSGSVSYPEQLAVRLAGGRSVLVSSPAHLKRLPDALDWTAARRSTCAVFSSGGPLPADAVASVERLLGRAPLEIYGSSETGGIAWRQRAGGVEQRWTPLPGVAVRVDHGGLSVRSRHLANEDWFALADQVALQPDGTFALEGRADRIAKVEGTRVSLTAIERALGTSRLVGEVRVVPLDGERDVLGAIVVPTAEGLAALREEGAPSVIRRLREMLADSTARVALPRRWRWVDALPLNGQGKLTRAEIARLFEAGPAMPPFHLLERSAAHAVIEMHPPASLVYFDGHFPGAPVLAGVVQVEWAIDLGRKLFGFTGDFLRVEALKFHRIFQPGPAMRIELDWRTERAVLRFQFSSVAGRHSSGRIFFAS